MKVLITGKGGQLAWELENTQPSDIQVVSLGIDELDLTNVDQVNQVMLELRPDVVINAAAYTAVDKAESDSTTAYAVNESGAENLAMMCKELGARMVHISTDFVFDGSQTQPYQTDAKTNPLSVYGASKLAGDEKVALIMGAQGCIIRTAWVYSAHGNNFVKTMLRLMAEREQLGIVYDQVGSPTWAKGLATMIWSLLTNPSTNTTATECPIYHWTDAGVASWYDFAIAIAQLGVEKGLLDKTVDIKPIPAAAYPTPAQRPSFSVLDKSSTELACGISTRHWRDQLSDMLDELTLQSI